jgi:hypothetical protein
MESVSPYGMQLTIPFSCNGKLTRFASGLEVKACLLEIESAGEFLLFKYGILLIRTSNRSARKDDDREPNTNVLPLIE